MNTRQIIAKNTILQIGLNFFNLLAGFYSISLIAKYLGKTSFGKYGFVYSFYLFFLTFLDFGISTIAIKEVSKERKNADVFLTNLITFKFILSVIMVFAAIAIANIFPFPQDLKLALSFYSPVLIFIALGSIQIIFAADLRYEYIAVASFFWRVSSLLFVVLSIRFNLGLAAIIVSFLLAEIVKSLILYLYSRKFIKVQFPVINIRLWLKIIKPAIPIGITSVLITIMRNMDVMLLTKIRGFAEVGLYTASSRLCDVGLTLPLALIGSVFPLMAKTYKEDLNALRNIHQKTFDILSVCGVLFVVLVLALADKMIILLFGTDYMPSVASLKILIFSTFFVYLAIGSGTVLVVADRQILNMCFYLLGVLLNIILNLILIPRFGFVGAAISNVITMLLVISLTFYFVSKRAKIPLETTKFRKAVIAGLATLFILSYLKDVNLYISITIGILIYSILVIFFKGIDREDIVLLSKRKIQ